MQIVYLDQNKWIDLSRAVKYPADNPELRTVLEVLVEEANAGRIVLPLTQTNIYETHKINDPERRHDLAYVQATLSQGRVFRGRHKRLDTEVTDVLRGAYGLEPIEHAPHWFLSNVFFEATLEWKDPRLVPISERVMEAIQKEPPRHLFEYLMLTPDDVRVTAVARFTEGSGKVRQQIEARRARDANESLSMRRRIQSAMLIANELDLILGLARNAGLPERNETEILRKTCRKIINDAPTFFIEREIAIRLEAQPRSIEENDLRDMQTFCAVVAYADIVVAENLFSNLATQAGLQKKFETVVSTNLLALPEQLQRLSGG
ncbi:MAG: hypothetical protein JWP25_4888 [Bradyrhizobium sp.]|nr:hypothetical protein [Bradyrhizobium sp.]